jgi:hypothetical protein
VTQSESQHLGAYMNEEIKQLFTTN